jgi:hypothetical protein
MRLLYVIPFIICIFLILLTFNSRNWENQRVDKIPKPLGEMPIPIHQKSEENKQSQPFKNQEQNITIQTEPNSYHTTTYKIYNRTQTPPPPYPSRSPDLTTNSETKNLEKLDMDTNYVNHVEMQTKYILIVSTWRSGSTFFGDLLTQYPGTYYSYEPLQYLSKRVNH